MLDWEGDKRAMRNMTSKTGAVRPESDLLFFAFVILGKFEELFLIFSLLLSLAGRHCERDVSGCGDAVDKKRGG